MIDWLQRKFPFQPCRKQEITPYEQYKALWFPVAQRVADASCLLPELAALIAQYQLAEAASHWYTTLVHLSKICPELLAQPIPRLQEDILQILDSPSPLEKEESDVVSHKIGDTYELALFLQGFGTVNELTATLQAYGATHYPEKETPLCFRFFDEKARKEHADTPPPPTYWGLMSKKRLFKSRGSSWDGQIPLIQALSQRAGILHRPSTLRETLIVFATCKIGGGESLYPAGTQQGQIEADGRIKVSTLIRVQETTENLHLAFGCSHTSGVSVVLQHHHPHICIAAIRILK